MDGWMDCWVDGIGGWWMDDGLVDDGLVDDGSATVV